MQTAPHPSGYAGREVTQPPNWHGLVAWDFFLNALTAGLFLVTAVGELVRPTEFAPLAVWAYPLALLLLLADLSCLVFDLGNPARFHHMLRVFKPTSPMSLGTWFLAGYSLPLTGLVALDLASQAGWFSADSAGVRSVRVILLVAGLPLAFGSAAYKGVLFSTTAQPGWRDARWLGAYHAASALALGAALLLILAATGAGRAADALRPAAAVLVALQAVPLVLLAVKMRPAFFRRFGLGERLGTALAAVAGVLIPVPVLLSGAGPTGAVVVAVLVLIAGWAVRRAIVLLPQPAHVEG